MAARPPREPEADLEAGDAVALMSIHQAKGLEWPVAVVPDLAARPPSDRRRAELDADGRVCVSLFDVGGESFRETASLRRLRAASSAAESAESRRLLYVALTRARDYLVLSAAGTAPAGSWAEVVGGARPELLRLLDASAPPIPAVAAPPAPPRAPAHAEPQPVGEEPPPLRRPAPVLAVRQSVTALAEYARCPRRHWFSRHLRLAEPRAGTSGQDDPDRATERGTLAHALLAEVDLLAPPLARRALLAAAASRRGYDPSSDGVRRIVGDVERFLMAEPGRALARWETAGALRREVPFLLRLGEDPAPCYLDGAIDALVVERGEVRVVDFKYAVWRRDASDRYRLQLLAYALAASRAWPGRRVRAALQFLRGGMAAVDLSPSRPELDRFAAEAPALARGASRAAGRDLSPGELGRIRDRCRAEGCGYAGRCFARPEPVRLSLPAAPAGGAMEPAGAAARSARAASGT